MDLCDKRSRFQPYGELATHASIVYRLKVAYASGERLPRSRGAGSDLRTRLIRLCFLDHVSPEPLVAVKFDVTKISSRWAFWRDPHGPEDLGRLCGVNATPLESLRRAGFSWMPPCR